MNCKAEEIDAAIDSLKHDTLFGNLSDGSVSDEPTVFDCMPSRYICMRKENLNLTNMQSSMLRAGVQWNMPVLSYFISVFSKSKSFAWSSAMPTSNFPFFCWSAGLFVGLQQGSVLKWSFEFVCYVHRSISRRESIN